MVAGCGFTLPTHYYQSHYIITGGQPMNCQQLIDLARQHAAAPPSGQLQQTRLHLAVSSAYYAVYHALAHSNADLLIGASETERGLPDWRDI